MSAFDISVVSLQYAIIVLEIFLALFVVVGVGFEFVSVRQHRAIQQGQNAYEAVKEAIWSDRETEEFVETDLPPLPEEQFPLIELETEPFVPAGDPDDFWFLPLDSSSTDRPSRTWRSACSSASLSPQSTVEQQRPKLLLLPAATEARDAHLCDWSDEQLRQEARFQKIRGWNLMRRETLIQRLSLLAA